MTIILVDIIKEYYGEKEGIIVRRAEEKEEEGERKALTDMERLKLGPTKLWTGLVLHHKDIFVSPSRPVKDRQFFFSMVNNESPMCLSMPGRLLGIICLLLFTNVHRFQRWNNVESHALGIIIIREEE